MEYIGILIHVNRVIVWATLILYATFFLGLCAQIVLGCSQVLTGIVLLYFIKNFSKKNQKRLKFYWGFVITYGILWITGFINFYDDFVIIAKIILPLSIAGYFTFILESIKKEL